MNTQTKTLLEQFKLEWQKIYGNRFFVEETKDKDLEKLVVMTEKLAAELRAKLNDQSVIVSSLDKDESIGKYFKVKPGQTVQIHHFHRSEKELERLLKNLKSRDMITLETDESGETIMKNELMEGELFRGFSPIGFDDWLAVAVYHDFVDVAPKVLGWVRVDNKIEETQEKSLTRPEKLVTLDEAIEQFEETKYHLGGKSKETGFDCSSLTQIIIYQTLGIWLPKLSRWQAMVGEKIPQEGIQKGDLIFFTEEPDWSIEHVGIITDPSRTKFPTIFHADANSQKMKKQDLATAGWLVDTKYKIAEIRRFSPLKPTLGV